MGYLIISPLGCRFTIFRRKAHEFTRGMDSRKAYWLWTLLAVEQ